MAILPYLKQGFKNITAKPTTIAFPSKDAPAPQPNYRGRIVYDNNACINCGMCKRVCSPQAITSTEEKLNDQETKITFTFDLTSCTYCGFCAEFCPKKAIKLTEDYMLVGTKHEDFLTGGSFIKKAPPKPQFTPEQLAAMKAAAEAKKKAAAAAGGVAPSPAPAAPAAAPKATENPAPAAATVSNAETK